MEKRNGNKHFLILLTGVLVAQVLILAQTLLKEKNAFAETSQSGRYQISSSTVSSAFLVDTATGEVWFIGGKDWAAPEEFITKKIK